MKFFGKIDRYIIKKFLGTYVFAIILILAITVMFDINEKLDAFLKAPLNETIFDYFQKYDYPFPRESDLVNVDTGFGELKHSQIVLNRNGQKTRVHIWTVHIL